MNTQPDPFRLDGETALVTGGGTGLGYAILMCLAQAGAKVVLVGRRKEELARSTACIGPLASYVSQDLTQLARAGKLAAAAERAAGSPISILVNNAGIHLKRPAVDTTPEEFQSVLTTHVCAAHALTRAVLPGMLTRGHGSILFTASMAALLGIPLVIENCRCRSRYWRTVPRSSKAMLRPDIARVRSLSDTRTAGWFTQSHRAHARLSRAGVTPRSVIVNRFLQT